VEYTFKNSLSEKACTIVLGNEALTIECAGLEKTISYDRVTAVRLSRKNGQSYGVVIRSRDHRPITVTNKYHLSAAECEDRSRQYAAFVRILHHHLKTKAAPLYTSGKSLTVVMIWMLPAAFFSFVLSFISEYFGFSLINPFGQSLILTLSIVSVMIAINRGAVSKQYSPEDIPFQYLP
jgi:hypothetical protein